MLLYWNPGLLVKPAVASSPLTDYATVSQINNQISPKPAPTWEAIIKPQLVRRDQQIAQQRAAADAALAAQQLQDQIAAEAQKQANLAQQRAEAIAVKPSPPTATIPGDCASWMQQAGITDTANAMFIISRESGCNPNARNGSSGACGIGQQLPCGKWPHTWDDPVGGMVDMQNYVIDRYGSWANAVAHWETYSSY